MGKVFAQVDEIVINRSFPKGALLETTEGDFLWRFDSDVPDDAIRAALAFANQTFRKGVELGRAEKAAEILAALREGQCPTE